MSLFIGLMSGTSIDAIDAALVEFNSQEVIVRATHCHPWPIELRNALLSLTQHTREQSTLHHIATLDIQVGELFGQAVLNLLTKIPSSEHKKIQAIGSAGQTIYHSPATSPPYTWQIGDPNVIAHMTGIPTITDFRRRDVAAGGQGAPLTPAFHQAWLRSTQESRIVLNIGGIANITVLPAETHSLPIGFDTGPGNALLDAYCFQQRQTHLDENGAWAAQGQVCSSLLERLLTDAYFAKPAPKSTGRDYFNLEWLTPFLSQDPLSPEDIQATLCQLTIESIVKSALPYQPQRLLVCGGGAHNPLIMRGLAQKLPHCTVESTSRYGIEPDWVEAVSFAWLAKQRIDLQTSNLPSVTGAKQAVILGSIYV